MITAFLYCKYTEYISMCIYIGQWTLNIYYNSDHNGIDSKGS